MKDKLKALCVKTKIQDLDDDGTYIAYAAVFGSPENVDRDGDYIKAGAFKKTIKKRKGIFPGVWMHDPRRPVAIGHVEEDEKGLLVHAQINLETQDGRELYSNMKMKIAGDHSFAFNPNWKKTESIKDDDGNVTGFGFGEVELLEFSPLTNGFGANPEAGLIALKWRSMALGYDKNVIDDVDSIDIETDIDSIGEAKAMDELIKSIRGLTSNINKFTGRS